MTERSLYSQVRKRDANATATAAAAMASTGFQNNQFNKERNFSPSATSNFGGFNQQVDQGGQLSQFKQQNLLDNADNPFFQIDVRNFDQNHNLGQTGSIQKEPLKIPSINPNRNHYENKKAQRSKSGSKTNKNSINQIQNSIMSNSINANSLQISGNNPQLIKPHQQSDAAKIILNEYLNQHSELLQSINNTNNLQKLSHYIRDGVKSSTGYQGNRRDENNSSRLNYTNDLSASQNQNNLSNTINGINRNMINDQSQTTSSSSNRRTPYQLNESQGVDQLNNHNQLVSKKYINSGSFFTRKNQQTNNYLHPNDQSFNNVPSIPLRRGDSGLTSDDMSAQQALIGISQTVGVPTKTSQKNANQNNLSQNKSVKLRSFTPNLRQYKTGGQVNSSLTHRGNIGSSEKGREEMEPRLLPSFRSNTNSRENLSASKYKFKQIPGTNKGTHSNSNYNNLSIAPINSQPNQQYLTTDALSTQEAAFKTENDIYTYPINDKQQYYIMNTNPDQIPTTQRNKKSNSMHSNNQNMISTSATKLNEDKDNSSQSSLNNNQNNQNIPNQYKNVSSPTSNSNGNLNSRPKSKQGGQRNQLKQKQDEKMEQIKNIYLKDGKRSKSSGRGSKLQDIPESNYNQSGHYMTDSQKSIPKQRNNNPFYVQQISHQLEEFGEEVEEIDVTEMFKKQSKLQQMDYNHNLQFQQIKVDKNNSASKQNKRYQNKDLEDSDQEGGMGKLRQSNLPPRTSQSSNTQNDGLGTTGISVTGYSLNQLINNDDNATQQKTIRLDDMSDSFHNEVHPKRNNDSAQSERNQNSQTKNSSSIYAKVIQKITSNNSGKLSNHSKINNNSNLIYPNNNESQQNDQSDSKIGSNLNNSQSGFRRSASSFAKQKQGVEDSTQKNNSFAPQKQQDSSTKNLIQNNSNNKVHEGNRGSFSANPSVQNLRNCSDINSSQHNNSNNQPQTQRSNSKSQIRKRTISQNQTTGSAKKSQLLSNQSSSEQNNENIQKGEIGNSSNKDDIQNSQNKSQNNQSQIQQQQNNNQSSLQKENKSKLEGKENDGANKNDSMTSSKKQTPSQDLSQDKNSNKKPIVQNNEDISKSQNNSQQDLKQSSGQKGQVKENKSNLKNSQIDNNSAHQDSKNNLSNSQKKNSDNQMNSQNSSDSSVNKNNLSSQKSNKDISNNNKDNSNNENINSSKPPIAIIGTNSKVANSSQNPPNPQNLQKSNKQDSSNSNNLLKIGEKLTLSQLKQDKSIVLDSDVTGKNSAQIKNNGSQQSLNQNSQQKNNENDGEEKDQSQNNKEDQNNSQQIKNKSEEEHQISNNSQKINEVQVKQNPVQQKPEIIVNDSNNQISKQSGITNKSTKENIQKSQIQQNQQEILKSSVLNNNQNKDDTLNKSQQNSSKGQLPQDNNSKESIKQQQDNNSSNPNISSSKKLQNENLNSAKDSKQSDKSLSNQDKVMIPSNDNSQNLNNSQQAKQNEDLLNQSKQSNHSNKNENVPSSNSQIQKSFSKGLNKVDSSQLNKSKLDEPENIQNNSQQQSFRKRDSILSNKDESQKADGDQKLNERQNSLQNSRKKLQEDILNGSSVSNKNVSQSKINNTQENNSLESKLKESDQSQDKLNNDKGNKSILQNKSQIDRGGQDNIPKIDQTSRIINETQGKADGVVVREIREQNGNELRIITEARIIIQNDNNDQSGGKRRKKQGKNGEQDEEEDSEDEQQELNKSKSKQGKKRNSKSKDKKNQRMESQQDDSDDEEENTEDGVKDLNTSKRKKKSKVMNAEDKKFLEDQINLLNHQTQGQIKDKTSKRGSQNSKLREDISKIGSEVKSLKDEQSGMNTPNRNPVDISNFIKAQDTSHILLNEEIQRDLQNQTYDDSIADQNSILAQLKSNQGSLKNLNPINQPNNQLDKQQADNSLSLNYQDELLNDLNADDKNKKENNEQLNQADDQNNQKTDPSSKQDSNQNNSPSTPQSKKPSNKYKEILNKNLVQVQRYPIKETEGEESLQSLHNDTSDELEQIVKIKILQDQNTRNTHSSYESLRASKKKNDQLKSMEFEEMEKYKQSNLTPEEILDLHIQQNRKKLRKINRRPHVIKQDMDKLIENGIIFDIKCRLPKNIDFIEEIKADPRHGELAFGRESYLLDSSPKVRYFRGYDQEMMRPCAMVQYAIDQYCDPQIVKEWHLMQHFQYNAQIEENRFLNLQMKNTTENNDNGSAKKSFHYGNQAEVSTSYNVFLNPTLLLMDSPLIYEYRHFEYTFFLEIEDFYPIDQILLNRFKDRKIYEENEQIFIFTSLIECVLGFRAKNICLGNIQIEHVAFCPASNSYKFYNLTKAQVYEESNKEKRYNIYSPKIYQAPELSELEGENDSGQVFNIFAADLYALGITLLCFKYHMISNNRTANFIQNRIEMCKNSMQLSGIIINYLLEEDPKQRVQNMRYIQKDLYQYLKQNYENNKQANKEIVSPPPPSSPRNRNIPNEENPLEVQQGKKLNPDDFKNEKIIAVNAPQRKMNNQDEFEESKGGDDDELWNNSSIISSAWNAQNNKSFMRRIDAPDYELEVNWNEGKSINNQKLNPPSTKKIAKQIHDRIQSAQDIARMYKYTFQWEKASNQYINNLEIMKSQSNKISDSEILRTVNQIWQCLYYNNELEDSLHYNEVYFNNIHTLYMHDEVQMAYDHLLSGKLKWILNHKVDSSQDFDIALMCTEQYPLDKAKILILLGDFFAEDSEISAEQYYKDALEILQAIILNPKDVMRSSASNPLKQKRDSAATVQTTTEGDYDQDDLFEREEYVVMKLKERTQHQLAVIEDIQMSELREKLVFLEENSQKLSAIEKAKIQLDVANQYCHQFLKYNEADFYYKEALKSLAVKSESNKLQNKSSNDINKSSSAQKMATSSSREKRMKKAIQPNEDKDSQPQLKSNSSLSSSSSSNLSQNKKDLAYDIQKFRIINFLKMNNEEEAKKMIQQIVVDNTPENGIKNIDNILQLAIILEENLFHEYCLELYNRCYALATVQLGSKNEFTIKLKDKINKL